MHFYPGVAQYDEPGKPSKRVFVNEDTIRKLDPTFAAKPVFVDHVDEVDPDINKVKDAADGWVIESFFNEADGKHWVKFIVVSRRGEQALQNGFRLSNSYNGQLNGRAGTWNGVTYNEEVVGGEYDHLALVKHPRYEESVVMTPDEFKAYNADLKEELVRIANSKDKEKHQMSKLKFWNRKPAENTADLETLEVTLPKSGRAMTIVQLVNEMDMMEEKKKDNTADPSHMVKLHDGTVCNVGELVEKHKAMSEMQNEEMSTDTTLKPEADPTDVEGDLHNGDEDAGADDADGDMQNEEDADKDKEKVEKKDNLLGFGEEKKDNFVIGTPDPKDLRDMGSRAVGDVKSLMSKDKKQNLSTGTVKGMAARAAGNFSNKRKVENATDKARREHFESIRNAHLEIKKANESKQYESIADGVARGKSRYGSGQ